MTHPLSQVAAYYNLDTQVVLQALCEWRPSEDDYLASLPLAKQLTLAAHKASQSRFIPSMEALLNQFPLNQQEGLALMCLAESLIRIPDEETRIALLRDQLNKGEWTHSVDMHNAVWLNSMVFGVATTKEILKATHHELHSRVVKIAANYGEKTIDKLVNAIVQQMAYQFVMGESLTAAWKKVRDYETYSFDMLGEAALTERDAEHYFQRYLSAADHLANLQQTPQHPTLSIKLSALHPRYEFHQERQVLDQLFQTAFKLIEHAVSKGVAVTIDAEETNRLEISLQLFVKLRMALPQPLRSHLGLAVQTYQKRALPVIRWLEQHAQESGARIPIRLVKGAYWDQEVKWSQQQGWDEFPVFTDKLLTDLSYEACARALLANLTAFYPQFATHNPLTMSSLLREIHSKSIATPDQFEFQRLFGMGEATYAALREQYPEIKCRVYAPIGEFKQLLPYLVRRMIENGANSSFVNQLGKEGLDLSVLLQNPWRQLDVSQESIEQRVTKPKQLYGEDRRNSRGVNLSGLNDFNQLLASMQPFMSMQWSVKPLTTTPSTSEVVPSLQTESMQTESLSAQSIVNPANLADRVGEVTYATPEQLNGAIQASVAAEREWQQTPVAKRADQLRDTADRMESNASELMALLIREAGKTYDNAQNELREAVDFLRYYANEAERLCQGVDCPGPSGEINQLFRTGVGTFICVSPWNFPLAIFTGQVAAALVAGNPVIAKPALETPLIGYRVVEMMHQSGIPKAVLHYLPAQNDDFDQQVWSSASIRGVAFTGSTRTAQHIHRQLALRDQPDTALPRVIAETGGMNAMVIDSSALLDQAVMDVIQSAFDGAGQRCSAARVVYVQEAIFDDFMQLLKGRMATLNVGDPKHPEIDMGPIISKAAQERLLHYIEQAKRHCHLTGGLKKHFFQSGHLYIDPDDSSDSKRGYFIPPTVIEIDHIQEIGEERFGPILHVIRFARDRLTPRQDESIDLADEINSTGYGLTFGIHTRLDERAERMARQVQAGNIYINRNIIGAIVETQPFGGRGLSGTGPKAGGPDYLLAFMGGKTISNNISAKGGDPGLYLCQN